MVVVVAVAGAAFTVEVGAVPGDDLELDAIVGVGVDEVEALGLVCAEAG